MQTQEQKLKDQHFETILWSLLIHAGLIGLLLIPVLVNFARKPALPQEEIQWLGDGSEGLPAEGGASPGDGNPVPPPPPPPDDLPPPPPPDDPPSRREVKSNLEKAEETDEKSQSEIRAQAEDLKKRQEALKKKKLADEKKKLAEKKLADEKKRLADEKKRLEASDLKNRLANAKKSDANNPRNKVYSTGRTPADIANSLKAGTGGGGTGTPGSRPGIKGGTGPGGGSPTGSADVAYDQLLQTLCKRLWAEPSQSELNSRNPMTTIKITIGSNGRILDAVISEPSGIAAMDSSVRRVCDRLRDEQLPPFVNFKISGTVIVKQVVMQINK